MVSDLDGYKYLMMEWFGNVKGKLLQPTKAVLVVRHSESLVTVNSIELSPCAMDSKALKSISKKPVTAHHVAEWDTQLRGL